MHLIKHVPMNEVQGMLRKQESGVLSSLWKVGPATFKVRIFPKYLIGVLNAGKLPQI